MRAAVLVLVALLAGAPVAAQQAPGERWPVVTELAAGAGLDLVARGPWVAKPWRRSLVGRLTIAVGTSALYEYGIEVWNGVPNASKAKDFQQRLWGTLGAEAVIWIGRRLFD